MKPTSLLARRSSKRGFTLLEVAIVAAIAGVIFLLLLRWVGSLVSASASGLEVNGTQRDVTYAVDSLRTDTEAARSCDPYGLDTPIREIQQGAVWLHVDTVGVDGSRGPDGKVDLVGWRVASGGTGRPTSLQRVALPGGKVSTQPCVFEVTTNPTTNEIVQDGLPWRILVENLDPATTPTFVGHRGGTARSASGDYGSCTGMAAERCLYDGLQVRFTVLSKGDDPIPVESDTLLPVNLATTRLG